MIVWALGSLVSILDRVLAWLLVVAFVLVALPSSAQTATGKLAWDQPLNSPQTFADVQAFAWTLKVDSGTPVVVTPTCVNGTPIKCSVPLPTLAPASTHTLTITANNGIGTASGTLTGSSPANPINIVITVTVTVP